MAEKMRRRARAFLRGLTSFPALCAVLLILEVWATLPLYIHDPDVWWHITVGTRILQTHTWPTADTFSFTAAGNPWIAYEWLAEILIALAAHSGAALAGLAWLRVALGAALMLQLYYFAYLRCRNSTAAFFATAFVYWLAYGFFTLRPQLLGYIFLMTTLICLERFRLKQQKSLWLLPVVFLLWVNTHGTFLLGLGIIAVYWASGLREWQYGRLRTLAWTLQERRHLAVVSLLSVLALLVTPYGSRLAAYPFQMAFFQPYNLAHVAEWQPIGFAGPWGESVLVTVLLFFVANLVFRPTWRVEEVVFLLGTFYGACVHRRMFLLFALFFAPMVATLLAPWLPVPNFRRSQAVLNASLMLLLGAGMVMFFPSHRSLERSVARLYPVNAVEYLRGHPAPGPMFNEYLWGGYLIWKLSPRHRVFIDGRADLYEHAGVFADYIHIMDLTPHTLFLLRKYSIRSCLLAREDPLVSLLAALPGWRREYEDDVSVLYVRKSTTPPSNSPAPGLSASIETFFSPGKTPLHFRLRPAEE